MKVGEQDRLPAHDPSVWMDLWRKSWRQGLNPLRAERAGRPVLASERLQVEGIGRHQPPVGSIRELWPVSGSARTSITERISSPVPGSSISAVNSRRVNSIASAFRKSERSVYHASPSHGITAHERANRALLLRHRPAQPAPRGLR